MRCNGCGKDIQTLAGAFVYGDIEILEMRGRLLDSALGKYIRTLCPRCNHIIREILLNSDLSEQWDDYEWGLVGDEYVEGYDDG